MNLSTFSSRDEASAAAAARISAGLQAGLQAEPRATFVASGGKTPKACYECLAKTDLAWSRVDVVPSDERNVTPGHGDHNGTMIAAHLATNNASAATLFGLEDFESLGKPIAVTLLGMGNDGHFASIFPDIECFEAAVDLSTDISVYQVTTKASPVSRQTLSLAALCRSRQIVLLAFGQEKKQILEHPAGFPVQHLLTQDLAPVDVFWSA